MAEEINYASWPQEVGRFLDIGDRKQLFLDDEFLVERTEGIRYVVNKPTKHPENPLMVPDRPWENVLQHYGSVLWDEEQGVFRIWYTCRTTRHGSASAVIVGYATSEDGLSWDKPELDVIDYEGAQTNAVLDMGPGGSGGVCVLDTPWDTSDRRYKMLYKTIEEGGGIKVAFSPDGLHWEKHPETVLGGVFDTFNVALWDGEKYVAYVRINQRPRKRYRSLGRIESEDFVHWTTPTIVLGPDDHDPEDSDLYTSAAFKYDEADRAYFMFPSLFDWRTGQLTPQLATSRDNVTWRRVSYREAVIPLGSPDSFESQQMMVGAPPVVKDDRVYVYYSGDNRPHFGGTGAPFETKSGIALATYRLDGFVSIEAGEKPSGGSVTTIPIQFSGTELEVNADATWGEIRVEILDDTNSVIEGFGEDACEPIRGDSVRHTVGWREKKVAELAGRTIKLRFRLTGSKLYAFQFVG
tara:strand:+ start:7712 stop:9109 length:1398 start_codon:yes stop_codon:yes gene_type:complete